MVTQEPRGPGAVWRRGGKETRLGGGNEDTRAQRTVRLKVQTHRPLTCCPGSVTGIGVNRTCAYPTTDKQLWAFTY